MVKFSSLLSKVGFQMTELGINFPYAKGGILDCQGNGTDKILVGQAELLLMFNV